LPSDWLDVAATYQLLPDKQLGGKVDRFFSFDICLILIQHLLVLADRFEEGDG